MDTCAIWMAVQQPVLVLQSFLRQLVKFRTAQINALHRIPSFSYLIRLVVDFGYYKSECPIIFSPIKRKSFFDK